MTEDSTKTDNAPPAKKAKRSARDISFLLLITQEDGPGLFYKAPIEAKSVVALKNAIAQCKELEKGWDYPVASSALAVAFQARLRDDDDDATSTDTDLCVVNLEEISRNWAGPDTSLPTFNTRTIIPDDEVSKWTSLDDVYSSFEPDPTELVQLCVLDGWC